jgi:hypothetical protein
LISIPFESTGAEIISEGAADVDIEGMVFVLALTLSHVPEEGRLTLQAQSAGTQLRGEIQARGACRAPVDICDLLTNYKDRIREEVPTQVVRQINDMAIQTEIRDNLARVFAGFGIYRIRRMEVREHAVVLEF